MNTNEKTQEKRRQHRLAVRHRTVAGILSLASMGSQLDHPADLKAVAVNSQQVALAAGLSWLIVVALGQAYVQAGAGKM